MRLFYDQILLYHFFWKYLIQQRENGTYHTCLKSVYKYACTAGWVTGLAIGLSLILLPYFVYTSNEGSDETALIRSFASPMRYVPKTNALAHLINILDRWIASVPGLLNINLRATKGPYDYMWTTVSACQLDWLQSSIHFYINMSFRILVAVV